MKVEIEQFNPCEDALEFRKQFISFEDAWNNCHRGDWMLWIAKRLDVDLKTLTKAKALCALTVRHLMKDQRSINACKVALRFSEGKATHDELDAAAAYAVDAVVAAYSTYYDSAYFAAYSAYSAAHSVDAVDAAYSAYSAYAAYAVDVADDARKKSQQQTADICRKVLTDEVFNKIKQYENTNQIPNH